MIYRLPIQWMLLLLVGVLSLSPVTAATIRSAPVAKIDNKPAIVYGIAQDQQDFLWLASEFEGLLRFDGHDFMRYLPPPELPQASFSQVVSMADNSLWFSTWGHGVWQLDPQRQRWQQLDPHLLGKAKIQVMRADGDRLWIGSTAGLFVYKLGETAAHPVQALAGQRIWALSAQNEQTLWVATSSGVFRLDDKSKLSGDWFSPGGVFSTEIRSLLVHDQQLLVGVREGLFWLDLTSGELTQTPQVTFVNVLQSAGAGRYLAGTINGLFELSRTAADITVRPLLSATDVRQIFTDRQQQLWLGSRSHGLLQLPPAAQPLFQPAPAAFLNPQQKHRLGPLSVTNNSLWLPLERHVLQFDGHQWQSWPFAPGHSVAYIRDVVSTASGPLVGTDQGLFRPNTNQQLVLWPVPTALPRLNVESMSQAADGSLWLGLWENGLLRVELDQQDQPGAVSQLIGPQQASDGFVDIQRDEQQQLWLLTRSGKLYQQDDKQVALRWQVPTSYTTGYFHCLLAEADYFWLCTDRGLLRLSRDFSQHQLLDTSDGLPDLRVIGITRSRHYIWVLTKQGVMAQTPDRREVYLLRPQLPYSDQLAQLRGIIPVQGHRQRSSDQVLIATDQNLWQLDISHLSKVPSQMQLQLTELRSNQQSYGSAPPGQIHLPAKATELQLTFRLLSFQSHLPVRYFYRWRPDDAWSSFSKDAVLTLSQLPPGEHHLQVMAKTAGQQILASPLQLVVPTPWWQRPAGIGLLLLAGLLLAALSYRWRLSHLQQRARQLDALVASRTSELEAANQRLHQLSHTDSLTGLMNRRAMQQATQQLQAQRHRHFTPLTLALLDIDHFKQINDQFGHDAGDRTLQQIALYLQQRLRAQDLVARWGGEEFLLLMPNTSAGQAGLLLEELRLGVLQLQAGLADHQLSATIGYSAVETGPLALEQALKAADQALYLGKSQGRNQVVAAQ